MSYSPPKYPAEIPNQTTDLPDRTDDISWIEAWIYNYVKKELIAVMTELGTNPSGTYDTVKAWLEALDAAGVDESIILNIYLNSFRLAVLGSYSIMNMIKGISDEYEDETGIDTGASTNEDYDATNDLYKPTAAGYSSDLTSGQTYDTNATDGTLENLFDDNITTIWSCTKTSDVWASVQWATGKIITKLTLINHGNVNAARYCRLEGSNDGSNWTKISATSWDNCNQYNTDEIEFLENDSLATVLFANNTTSYTYYRLYVISNYGGGWVNIHEIEMMESTPDNMTLISDTFTADEQPDEARIIIFEEDVDSITLNTDIKAYASRDDGTTWTQITLSDEGKYSGTKRILSGTADISGQPSGTSTKYKIETLNNKNLKLHGAALSWA